MHYEFPGEVLRQHADHYARVGRHVDIVLIVDIGHAPTVDADDLERVDVDVKGVPLDTPVHERPLFDRVELHRHSDELGIEQPAVDEVLELHRRLHLGEHDQTAAVHAPAT